MLRRERGANRKGKLSGVYQATREFEDSIPPQFMLQAVWAVEDYPSFVKGVAHVEVLERSDTRTRAEFTASLGGMKFSYQLEITRDEREVRWKRVSGAFRDAAGAMIHLGGQRYRYENAMDPGFAVPELAVKFVLNRSLPRLLREFRGQAQALTKAATS